MDLTLLERLHHLQQPWQAETATATATATSLHQCNSATGKPSSLKKRKAELDAMEDVKQFKSEDVGEENSEVTCSKASEVQNQKPDYIHVRARRGQATDSHSLAERARREKISKKMKCLQDLVPGCKKVIGKAGMLDEIINYVQSLQKQVEFLSMKLSAVNPRMDLSIDNFFTKEIPAYLATAQFDASNNSACFQYNPIQPSYQAIDDQPQLLPQKAAGPSSSVPIPDMFLDPSCIPMSGWESDWPNLFSGSFH